MTPEQIVDAIMVLIKQHGFDGKLDKQELVALTGVCLQEFEGELELAAKLLGESPSRESLLDFYQTERAKETQEVGDQVDTSRTTVDIGKLKAVPFSAAMWEVVRESRFVGHLGKLDEVNKYFASKWGNPAEGSFSIDAYLRRERRDTEAIACKNPPSSYPDWEVYNHPSGQKQPVRFRSDLIMCENASCSSEGASSTRQRRSTCSQNSHCCGDCWHEVAFTSAPTAGVRRLDHCCPEELMNQGEREGKLRGAKMFWAPSKSIHARQVVTA